MALTESREVGPRRRQLVALYTPKLLTVLREGYGLAELQRDALAGLTVAIVALPLSMAIAMASGATPAQGLYTAIVGGFLVSLLGGSRFQIGGPAGAFIVLVAATIQLHGLDGLLLATLLSGLMLVAAGALRLGTYIKFIPYPVTVGFTAGIAAIILASQVKELLGLRLAGPEPGPLPEKLAALWQAAPTLNATAALIALGTIALIAGLKRLRPHWPGMLIAIALAAAGTALFELPVDTIGSRFGGIPSSLPLPRLPEVSWTKVQAVLPNAVSFTLLGAIESLLSAVVADGMTGRRHRSNCELVAQGVANVASSLFGGLCVTGTIARTATNVRSGAHGPVAGMLHALFLLAFVLLAAPLAAAIPLAALAGVLAVVAWNMVERHAIAALARSSRGEAAVLLVTLLLTVFRDLTEAIVVGIALGALLTVRRLARATEVETHLPLVSEDRPDATGSARTAYSENAAGTRDVAVIRISGAFFFGAAAAVGGALERTADTYRVLIVDLSAVPFVDSTAIRTVEGLAERTARRGGRMILSGAAPSVRRALEAQGVGAPQVEYAANLAAAQARAVAEAPSD
jgi:SulP family sulfate permease